MISISASRVVVPVILSSALLLGSSGCGKAKTVDFSQADTVADVTYQCTGTCGDVVTATVKVKAPEKIEFTITKGTILKGMEGQEDLALVRYRGKVMGPGKFDPKKPFTISSGSTLQVALEGYSLQAFAPAGMGKTQYKIEGQAKDKTLAVLNALNDSDTLFAKQFAVWVTTDDITPAQGLELLVTATEADIDGARAIVERAGLQPNDFRLFNPALEK